MVAVTEIKAQITLKVQAVAEEALVLKVVILKPQLVVAEGTLISRVPPKVILWEVEVQKAEVTAIYQAIMLSSVVAVVAQAR
jgi:hypothetical protein